jgi:glycosyltransferase involved in cell wall biosynthesis
MKICYLANAKSVHTFRWVNYFSRKKHDVFLISLETAKFDFGRVKVKVLEKPFQFSGSISHFLNLFPLLSKLKKILKEKNFDLLHAFSSSNAWLASLTKFSPLIITIAEPGILPDWPKPFYYNVLNSISLKRANLITTDGENTKEAMVKLGADSEIIKIVRFGVNIEKFKPQRNERLKEEMFGKNIKIVISTKPLRPESNLSTLIEAVPKVLEKLPNTRFLILGDGEEKEKLEKRAKNLKIDWAIKFLGFVSPEKLPLYYNSADIFVSTSLVDSGIAASIAEAMACGLPLVVSDAGDNRLIIKDGENGFIFPRKNSELLAQKLILLLKDENLQKKFYLTHRRWIVENNNYQKEMEKMEKIYLSFKK